MKETGGTGHIRNSATPNVRVQDGLKLELLCEECEQVFSRWERLFATKIFHPFRTDQGNCYRHEEWLLKFCVSVSWRALIFFRQTSAGTDLSPSQVADIDKALTTWREFLLGLRPHPGKNEQHLLPFKIIESTSIPGLPPTMNRFLTRGTHMDLLVSDGGFISTFVKMGPFSIFGHITESAQKWRGSRVSVLHGTIRPRDVQMPQMIMDYLIDKANETHKFMQSMSGPQHEKIQKTILANAERMKASELMKAIVADVEMFGPSALTEKPRGAG